jgi:hypothetical protein
MAVFSDEGGEIGFEVYSDDGAGGEEILHCRGHGVLGPRAAAQRLDLGALRAQMQRPVLDGGVMYPLFSAMGLQYGPSFQGIVAVHQGENQVLVELKLPEAARASGGDFVLHPSLMDGALQGSIVLMGDTAWGKPLLPFAVESLRVLAPCTELMLAWIRYTDGARAVSSGLTKVDIDLCDADGTVCVQMRGFSSRSTEDFIRLDDGASELLAQNAVVDHDMVEQGEARAARVRQHLS